MNRNRSSRMTARGLYYVCLAAFCAAMLPLGSAEAAPMVYGDYAGATVDYLGVQEESSTDPGLFPFGAPTIAGDSLDFDPQGFAASSTNLDSDITDSNLQFMVEAKPGFAINALSFSEGGDTTLSGLVGEAMTTVGAEFFVDIVEVLIAGVPTPVSLTVPPESMTFTPGDEFLLSVDGPGTSSWTGSLFVDMGPTLMANGVVGAVSKVNVSLNNTLSAASEQGTAAFIQKKDADALVVSIETFVIPEPTTAAMGLAALIACGSTRRRDA